MKLSEAVKFKKAGQIDKAIECLYQAYYRIEKYKEKKYPLNVFLRLPMYLQADGKYDIKVPNKSWSKQ